MEYFSSITFLFVLSTTLFVLGNSSSHNTHHFLQCLQSSNSISNVVYTPGNASYSSIFQFLARNLRAVSTSKQRPLAIITPIDVSEIQAAIYCSREHGVQLRVRSGGHDYEGLSYISGSTPFFILDMRNLRSISVDTEENTAWVQTGATLGQLYYTIAQASRTLAFTAGLCPSMGVGGHISGGGYGMMSRKHGLAIDHVIDAKLIDANGRVLDRESMGEDLFWAIRGGGGTSFGIVLAFKLNLIADIPQIVTVFNVSRTLEQNATQLVHKWQYISDKVDENLLIRVFLNSVRSPRNGGRTIQADFTSMYLGRAHDLLPIMQENFPELGLRERDCIEMSWIESILYFAGFHNQSLDTLVTATYPNTFYFKGKSDYVRQPIPESGLEGIWELLNEEDAYRAPVHFAPYGGVMNTYSKSETPFPHRSGNIFMIEYAVNWDTAGQTESERHVNWIRKLYSYMASYASKSPRAAYCNYRDLDLGMNNEGNTSYRQASVWGFKYFENNFKRLVRVKTKVDPSNFFRHEQSIPPLYNGV